jgi:hypothetical protein
MDKCYNINKLNTEQKRAFFLEAHRLAKSVIVDQLNCSASFLRQPTSKSFNEILEIALHDESDKYWSCILRNRSYLTVPIEYFDIGVRTSMKHTGFETEYFIWLDLSTHNGYDLISRYQLELQ